jgi:hypothetical protein
LPVEKKTLDTKSPALPGTELSVSEFNKWIHQAENAPTISLSYEPSAQKSLILQRSAELPKCVTSIVSMLFYYREFPVRYEPLLKPML